MPISPENKCRYPADWTGISIRIRFERAGGQCECDGRCGRGTHEGRCPNRHLEPAYGTGSKVILTTAHLVSATHLPVNLCVTGATEADQIVELVGTIMRNNTEESKRDDVVHNRALTEFLSGPSASSARFVIALPSGTLSGSPSGSVVADAATIPQWVILTRWRLSTPPDETTNVPAETAPSTQMISRYPVLDSATLANTDAERSLLATNQFVATGVRASADAIRRLLRRDHDYPRADDAFDTTPTPALGSPDTWALNPFSLLGHELNLTDGRTSDTRTAGIMGEVAPTIGAVDMAGAQSGSGHSELYHIGYLPEDCSDENLMAMCQGCHLHYDRDHHKETKAAARRKAEAGAIIAKYPEGIPIELVTEDVLLLLLAQECDHVHRGPQGPNEDMAWCTKRMLPTFALRPKGETFGEHAPDCSLPLHHESYCVGGGQGHPKAELVRGFWPEEPPIMAHIPEKGVEE